MTGRPEVAKTNGAKEIMKQKIFESSFDDLKNTQVDHVIVT